MPLLKAITQSPIPKDWDLTPEWMTAIFSRQYPGAKVSSVRLLDGSDGTSSRARFEIKYAEGDGPETVFAKTKGSWLRRIFQLMTDNAFIEGQLFLNDPKLSLEHPRVYYSAVDRLRLNDLIVMEDMSKKQAIMNDATRPLSVDNVASGLSELAKLHSQFWNFTTSKQPELNWVQPWRASKTFQWLLQYGCKRGGARLEHCLPKPIVAAGPQSMVHHWTQYLNTVNKGPHTLLHGDAHVGNTYLLPDGTLGFLDWAVVRRGHWSFDVGYFIISCLNEEDRRLHSPGLVEVYRQALQIPEHERPSREEAWLRFRASPAYGLAIWVTTGAEDNYQSPAICASLAGRFGAAFVELETPLAIERLSK